MDEHTSVATLVQDAAAFRAWLVAQAPDAMVGVACKAEDCPVATWLHQCYGDGLYVEVYPRRVVARSAALEWVRLVAPIWVEDFVDAVDAGRDASGLISAATALAVFDAVVQWM